MGDSGYARPLTTPDPPTVPLARPTSSTPAKHPVASDAFTTASKEVMAPTEPLALKTDSSKTDAEETLRVIKGATESLLPVIDILSRVCQDLGALAPQLSELGKALRRNADHIVISESHTDNQVVASEPAPSLSISNLAESRQSPPAKITTAALADPFTTNSIPEKKSLDKQTGNRGTRPTQSGMDDENDTPDTDDSDSEDSSGSSLPLMNKRQKTSPSRAYIPRDSDDDRENMACEAPTVSNDAQVSNSTRQRDNSLDEPRKESAGVYALEHPPLGLPARPPKSGNYKPRTTNQKPGLASLGIRQRLDIAGTSAVQFVDQESPRSMIGRHAVALPARPPSSTPEVGVGPRNLLNPPSGRFRVPASPSPFRTPSCSGNSLGPHPVSRGPPRIIDPIIEETWPKEWFTDMPSQEEIRAALRHPLDSERAWSTQNQEDVSMVRQVLERHFSQQAHK